MLSIPFTQRDQRILEKLNNLSLSSGYKAPIDDSLPKDPHYPETHQYNRIAASERSILSTIYSISQGESSPNSPPASKDDEYLKAVASLSQLIAQFPQYASARNNRAQALRWLYDVAASSHTLGDERLEVHDGENFKGTIQSTVVAEIIRDDLDTAIALLTPEEMYSAVSPQAGRTLSAAYMQRGALNYAAATMLHKNQDDDSCSDVDNNLSYMASQDFAMGGRYGHEEGGALAVHVNPMAQLCGQTVIEMMRREGAA
jgi:hypothetical protein